MKYWQWLWRIWSDVTPAISVVAQCRSVRHCWPYTPAGSVLAFLDLWPNIYINYFSWNIFLYLYKQNFRLLDCFKSNGRKFYIVILTYFFISLSIYRLSWFKSFCSVIYKLTIQNFKFELNSIHYFAETNKTASEFCVFFCANKMRRRWGPPRPPTDSSFNTAFQYYIRPSEPAFRKWVLVMVKCRWCWRSEGLEMQDRGQSNFPEFSSKDHDR